MTSILGTDSARLSTVPYGLKQKFSTVRIIREMQWLIIQTGRFPFTRIIEHKHFEFEAGKTVISREYSSEWSVGMEPYYPVNDEKNNQLFQEYKKLAEKEKNVIFGGRLGDYKYMIWIK